MNSNIFNKTCKNISIYNKKKIELSYQESYLYQKMTCLLNMRRLPLMNKGRISTGAKFLS